MLRVRWKDFEMPVRLNIDEETASDTYTRFIIEPFERGLGHAIGNSLRRCLYSSIEGAAPCAVKIRDVPSEFSTIENVLEDVPEIVLNIKELLVKMDSPELKTLTLEAKKKGEVVAEMIKCPPGVEILNPQHKICTIVDEPALVDMQIFVKKGRRYVSAEKNRIDLKLDEIGIIPLDSNFSPVQRVAYKVENTRVGRRSDYEKIIMDIWTNGIVTPEQALVEAAKILRKHLNPFIFHFELSQDLKIPEKKPSQPEPVKIEDITDITKTLEMPVSALEFSVKVTQCLESAGIKTVGELVRKTDAELEEIKNWTKTSTKEVKTKLAKLELRLGMTEEDISKYLKR